MVSLHIQLNDITALLLSESTYVIINIHADLTFQYSETILRRPNNVVLAIPKSL